MLNLFGNGVAQSLMAFFIEVNSIGRANPCMQGCIQESASGVLRDILNVPCKFAGFLSGPLKQRAFFLVRDPTPPG